MSESMTIDEKRAEILTAIGLRSQQLFDEVWPSMRANAEAMGIVDDDLDAFENEARRSSIRVVCESLGIKTR